MNDDKFNLHPPQCWHRVLDSCEPSPPLLALTLAGPLLLALALHPLIIAIIIRQWCRSHLHYSAGDYIAHSTPPSLLPGFMVTLIIYSRNLFDANNRTFHKSLLYFERKKCLQHLLACNNDDFNCFPDDSVICPMMSFGQTLTVWKQFSLKPLIRHFCDEDT